MKTHVLCKYQDGIGGLASQYSRCFRHDVAVQEVRSTSVGMHDRGLCSESTSSSLRCSTSRATGVFRSFLLHRMATARMQWRTVWVRQRNHTYLSRAVTGWSEIEWKPYFSLHVGNCSEWHYVYCLAQLSLNRFVRPLGQRNCNLPVAPSSSAFHHF